MNDQKQLQEIKETVEKARGNWEWTYRIAWHCIEIIEQLQAENERYEKALRFYAEEKHYDMIQVNAVYEEVILDRGEVAKQALKA